VGVGWSEEKRKKLMQEDDNNYTSAVITLTFQFELDLQKFPRVFKNPIEPLQRLINYADFAIIHRGDIVYPPSEVRCTFDYLNYNFFCEQYAKVKTIINAFYHC